MSEAVNISPTASLVAQTIPLDCQPILERKGVDVWSRAASTRDELYDSLHQACEHEGIRALVLKSDPFVYPVWVRFDCWIPRQDRALTERTLGIITLVPKPFHRYELEYNLELYDRGERKKYPNLIQFTVDDAEQLVKYLLRRSPRPSYGSLQLRRYWFQFWKPINKVKTLRFNWVRLLPFALFILGLSMMIGGANNLLLLPSGGENSLLLLSSGLVLIVGAVVSGYFLSKQEALVRCSGKPVAEPRHLIRVDSWQAVISGLGEGAQELRERFLKSLEPPFTKEFRHDFEQIWYWGPDGKVEREQFVLMLGCAMVFCQIYQYDQELYVGWNGHLNIGQWVEKRIAKGIDKQARRPVAITSVVPGYQLVTEHHITDLNCLMEWTHVHLTKLVKELMEERKIDQEVDFKIQRGERQNLVRERGAVTSEEKTSGLAGNKGSTLSDMLRRTG
jgi:hypothetical protein